MRQLFAPARGTPYRYQIPSVRVQGSTERQARKTSRELATIVSWRDRLVVPTGEHAAYRERARSH